MKTVFFCTVCRKILNEDKKHSSHFLYPESHYVLEVDADSVRRDATGRIVDVQQATTRR